MTQTLSTLFNNNLWPVQRTIERFIAIKLICVFSDDYKYSGKSCFNETINVERRVTMLSDNICISIKSLENYLETLIGESTSTNSLMILHMVKVKVAMTHHAKWLA